LPHDDIWKFTQKRAQVFLTCHLLLSGFNHDWKAKHFCKNYLWKFCICCSVDLAWLLAYRQKDRRICRF